jgi:hypothetical protein
VAGTVGLTCTHIFGFRDPKALELSERLGLAFQLTNIIRDVREDFTLARIYLPEEDLLRYKVTHEDLARNEATLGTRALLRFEAERAWNLYEQGASLIGMIDEDSRGTLWLLVHTYSSLLARIESLDFAVSESVCGFPSGEDDVHAVKARFGRHTEENILAKRDRDRRRAGGLSAGISLAEAPAGAFAYSNKDLPWWPGNVVRVARWRARGQLPARYARLLHKS